MSLIDSSVYTLDSGMDKIVWPADHCQLAPAVPYSTPWTTQYCSSTSMYDYSGSTYWPVEPGTFDYCHSKDMEMVGACDSGINDIASYTADYRLHEGTVQDNCDYSKVKLDRLTSVSPSLTCPWPNQTVSSSYCHQQTSDLTEPWVDHCYNYVNLSDADLPVPVAAPAVVAANAADYIIGQQPYMNVSRGACRLVTSSECLPSEGTIAGINSNQCQQGKLVT